MPVLPRTDNPGRERGRPIRTGRPDRPVIQLPSVALRVAMLGVLAIVLISIIVFRLWFLQILSGQQYVAQANDNRLRTIKIVAPRGSITDRNGKVLVENRPGLAVGIRPMDVPPAQTGDLVRRLAVVLHMPAWQIRRQLAEHASYPDYDLVVIKEDVNPRTVSYLLEHRLSFPGVEVQQDYLRDYPLGDLAAHLLGHVGEINADQLKQLQFRHCAPGDVVGYDGVENAYDRWLRGSDGEARVQVGATTNRPPQAVPGGRLPQAGDNLVLTLDADVQKAAENAIRYGITLAHQNQMWRADAGAAVVLDARTGDVVAMATYPTFDPSWWVGGISAKHFAQLRKPSANDPLLDRADQGTYAIGSTFKVVDAVAGLEEGVITPMSTFTCPGYFKDHGSTWHCWIYPGAHGALDLTQAIVQSCDVFFYNVGLAFYHRQGTALEDWAMRMGLGHLTGIDIPGEAAGLVPTPAWLKATGTTAIDKLWKPGNSINLAIGQGNLLATPLQTAVLYATVANGGYVVQPHLGERVVDAQGRLVQRLTFRAPKKLDVSQQTLSVVQNALREAATVGTSSSTFGRYPIAVAGKTGTSEKAGEAATAWYASYAPADNPRYVVVVMIDQGGHGGTVAAPAARMIYDALFHLQGSQATGTLHSD